MGTFKYSGGVEVMGFISPTDPSDQYPVIDPLYGIDGFRNVNTLSDLNNIPELRRRAGMVVGVSGGTSYYKLNQSPWNYNITDWSVFNSGSGGDYLPLSGGTVTGATNFTNGLTANTISATTYSNLPLDIRVTGATYSNGSATFTNNTGGTFNVSGFYTGATDVFVTGGTYFGSTITFTNNTGGTFTVTGITSSPTSSSFTGGTITGSTTFTNGLTANTISATTYQNLPTDIRVTGGTYSNGTTIFTNNTGGSFNVTGFYTGATDVRVTGGTYGNGTATFTNNTGGTFTVTGFLSNAVTATTLSSNVLSVTSSVGSPTTTTINAATGGTYSNGTITLAGTGILSTITGLFTGGSDVFVTGSTYSNNTFTFTNNTGGTFSVLFNTVTGLTTNGNLTVTGTTSSGVISATTYQNLPLDIRVTGGTYSNGTATFTNNTGGTITVTGFLSNATTAATLSSNVLSVTSSGGSTTTTTINAATGGTYSNGTITLSGTGTLTTITGLFTGSTGPFGISNSGGTYTFYSTLTLAMSAATSGQVIEMFADVTETTNITITLKDGVNINGNGHTYTLNQVGTANTIQDGGVAVVCTISNITFRRLGGTGADTNTICMYITGASRIRCSSTNLITGSNMRSLVVNNISAELYDLYCEGYNPVAVLVSGSIYNSKFKALTGTGLYLTGVNAKAFKCIGIGIGASGIYMTDGQLTDCVGTSQNVNGIDCLGSSILRNCVGYGGGGTGIYGNGASIIMIDCIGHGIAGPGISGSSSYMMKCTGYSIASVGISSINGILYDCLGYSTVNNGIYSLNAGATIAEVRSCKAISLAAVAMFMDNTTSGCKIYNTESYSKWNNANGHGIKISGNNAEIIQCTIEVTNTSANAINATSVFTTKYANNSFKGSTTPINSNITQGITNTHDNYGNILI